MNNKTKYLPLILIKNNSTICNKLNECLSNNTAFCYFITSNYNKKFSDYEAEFTTNDRLLIFICDSKREVTTQILKILWCKYKIKTSKRTGNIYLECDFLYDSESEIVISNACNNALLDINKDFEESYIDIEYLPDIYEEFLPLEKSYNPFKKNNNKIEYKSLDSETNLCKLSQKNEYCLRENYVSVPSLDGRGEFRRDYDRIVYSKSFRRTADKTQVFSSSKGDYYRTRMTHTMIVCQISRSICEALNLNSALTEAIALGHDLGHTPFGHVGERALNRKCKDNGGFKHNYQGIRVASKLENQYIGIEGLDLSYQVLEGIFKHTRLNKDVNIENFVSEEIVKNLYVNYEFSITLEGQIVAIADEIAQRSHDIDDALTSKLLTRKEFLNYIKLNKFDELNELIEEFENKLNTTDTLLLVDKNELFSAQISSIIVEYFICDVIKKSNENIKKYIIEHEEDFKKTHIVEEQLINFSEKGNDICKSLEKILKNKILNSSEVSLADENSEIIINSLFDTYYKNPLLLHTGTKYMIYLEFIKDFKSGGNIHNIIDIIGGDPKVIKKEFNMIINEELDNDEIKQKRNILKRKICDYIAGMTDQYAIKEYNNICKMIINK